MSENKHHNAHISLHEMKEYLAGNLTGKESHQIEKHLQECNLCSDAMVGLEKMDPKVMGEDISKLKSLVSEKTKIRSRAGWTVRVAAAIILLTFSTYVVIDYLQTQKPESKELPETAIAAEDKADEEQTALRDSATKQTDAKPATDQIATRKTDVEEERESLAMADTEPDADTGIEVGHAMEETVVSAEEVAAADQEEMARSIEVEETKQAQPEPAPKQEIATLQETESKEKAISETSPQKSVSRRAARPRTEQPTQAAPELDVASSFTARAESSLVIEPVTGEEVYDKNAEPESGTVEYMNVILENLQYPQEASLNRISGQVTLTFMVGETGDLSDFKVIQGLGFGCDEEAIRVIREGPAWDPAIRQGKPSTQVIQVRIPFPKSD